MRDQFSGPAACPPPPPSHPPDMDMHSGDTQEASSGPSQPFSPHLILHDDTMAMSDLSCATMDELFTRFPNRASYAPCTAPARPHCNIRCPFQQWRKRAKPGKRSPGPRWPPRQSKSRRQAQRATASASVPGSSGFTPPLQIGPGTTVILANTVFCGDSGAAQRRGARR